MTFNGFDKSELSKTVNLLKQLISVKSYSGDEKKIQHTLFDEFSKCGLNVKKQYIDESVRKDSEYSKNEITNSYKQRPNLIVTKKGVGIGKNLVISTHCDTVPGKDWKEALKPQVKDGFLYGLGACDAKGQIVCAYMALKILEKNNIKLKGDVKLHIVIEEEVGGNGALSAVRNIGKTDGAVVMEPTGLNIHPSCRGALWFKIELEGKAVHMSRIDEGVNAVEKMMKVINTLRKYDVKLQKESKNVELFEDIKRPVQFNFGKINGGEWPSSVAGFCTLEGGVGFLHNKTIDDIKNEVTGRIMNIKDGWIKDHVKISFDRLHNDAHGLKRDHPMVTAFEKSAYKYINSNVTGCVFSSDSRLYSKIAKVPTLVFGPGSIEDAHSKNEKINIEELMTASNILAEFICGYCKVAN